MPSPLAELTQPRSFRRLTALVLVTMPVLRSGWLSRSGRLYAWSIALFYAALGAYLSHQGDALSAISVITLALTWISCAGGLVACAAARDLDEEERTAGLDRLTAARAVPRGLREPARLLASMAVVTRAVLLPALATTVVALALSPSARGAGVLFLVALVVTVYCVVFGVTFGALARWASALSSRYARVVFSLIVFVPAIANDLVGKTPSLPGCFAWLIGKIGELGALT